MYAFVAWFSDSSRDRREARARLGRAQAHLQEVTPRTWEDQHWSGDGWDVLVRQAPPGDWRWRFGERDRGTVAVAAGFALGGAPTSPARLGRELLDGAEIHRDLAAPFALLAVDESRGRVEVQQDWHGMGQMFHYQRAGAVALSNRPSALPRVFGDPVLPNNRGWAFYLAGGAFADDSSPVRRVRQLAPGENLSGRRDRRGRWAFESRQRFNVDDIVADAVRERPTLDELADATIAGSRRVVRSLSRYYTEPLSMGLSGGKDSRMLAAALVTDGLVSRFRTNEQTPAEGETARRLATVLKQRRGLDIDHEFYVAASSSLVPETTVTERARLLQRDHDFMYRSTYLNRSFHEPLPKEGPPPGILGVLGEYLSDYALPEEWKTDPATASHAGAHEVMQRKLSGYRRIVKPGPLERVDAQLDRLIEDAKAHGLDPFATITYVFMLGRLRRNTTALTRVEQIMPLAVPETIRASMQLTPLQKSERALHLRIIERLVPEWTNVPFVSVNTGVSPDELLRIWHGSGLADLKELMSRGPGPVSRLLRYPLMHRALAAATEGRGSNRDDAALRQFAMAAVADESFSSDHTA